jgi:glycosyltransferase involved in cell wall biosynthesis
MNIILATYNYYPFAWGGSEVYVHGLAKYLQQLGHTVAVIAAIPASQIPNNQGIKTSHLQGYEYEYDGVKILGVALHDESTAEIYGKYNTIWINSWKELMLKSSLFSSPIDILHYNGHTSVISVAIINALREHEKVKGCIAAKVAKVIASYHTPISCPNGKLLYFRNQECNIEPHVTDCTACFVNSQKKIPKFLANSLAMILPSESIAKTKLPNAFKVKHFVDLSLKSFQNLDNQVDKWLVMSDYIYKVIIRAGVKQEKISMIRHGIHHDFIHNFITTTEILQRTSNKTIFVYAGRFEKIKGFPTLLKTWLALPSEPQKRVLQIIGEVQSESDEINNLLVLAKQRNDIEFMGKKNATEMRTILQQSHCMIIPSEWIEIGPLVLHEAIACGADIIVSDIGGTAELANYYQEGCTTFKMGNQQDLSNKILNFQYFPIKHKVRSQKEHYDLVIEKYNF